MDNWSFPVGGPDWTSVWLTPLWTSNFGSYLNFYLLHFSFDHAHLFLVAYYRFSEKNWIFHFNSYWLDYLECDRIINSVWKSNANSSPLHAFTHYVNWTKTKLIYWICIGLNYLDRDIKDIELRIKEIEGSDSIVDDLSPDSCDFRVLYNRHKALLCQNSL